MNNNTALKNSTALITGGSSGIGFELAKLFAQDGYNLILIAQDPLKLQQAKKELDQHYKVTTTLINQDLSQPEASQIIYDKVTSLGLQVDVLVNNAGFGSYGLFHDLNLFSQLNMMQVNMIALTQLSHLFCQDMVLRKQGKILNIASTAAFLPGPLMAVYYATKAYVLSFSLALNNELKAFGITVSVVCPGPTKTHFSTTAHVQKSRIFKGGGMDVTKVAQISYAALMNNTAVKTIGISNAFQVFITRLFSKKLLAQIARQAQEIK